MARTLNKNPGGGDLSRLRRFAQNHLGVIMTDDMNQVKKFRDDRLDIFDRYYDNSQYEDLQDWDDAVNSDEYVPIRKRKPRVIYNVAKVIVDKVASKLVGSSTFPQFVIEDDDDDTAFFKAVQKACQFRASMVDPIKNVLKAGACFVRYYIVNGVPKIEYFKSKFCYPVFDIGGELDQCEIRYVYDDPNDKDQNGTPKQKWYKLLLTKTADIVYDNPPYRPGVRPTFQETGRVEHGLGWVQGEWLVTHRDKFDFDGYSLFGDILGFIDELNYSLSQASQAIAYNQEPQLAVNGLDEEELDQLIRSSQKAWNLGREGKAEFLQSAMEGVKTSGEEREKFRNLALDVVRVVIQDPEKMGGHAQSGEALRQLYAPLIELVDEIRTVIEPNLVKLLIKIGLTLLHFIGLGNDTNLEVPDGYMPSSLDLVAQWPAIFPLTIQDLQALATALNTLATGNIVSRETCTRFVAANSTIIDDPDEELKRIESQPPPPSPFGDFGGPPPGGK